MLVDFMLIGAQKCGTTSLAAQLTQHPAVCFCTIKEPGYFHQHTNWREQLPEYHALYQPEAGQLCGEASTMYTFLPEWQGTHERLHEYNPDLKLIYIMRNPVERVISNYTHDLVRNLVKTTPEAAIFSDPVYINRSRYGVQLRPYMDLFGPDQLLLLVFEEYIQDQADTLQRVANYLGLDPTQFAEASDVHAHKSVGEYQLRHETLRKIVRSETFDRVRAVVPAAIRKPMRRRMSQKVEQKPYFSPELRQQIWRFVEDDVRQVETWLGREITLWRKECA